MPVLKISKRFRKAKRKTQEKLFKSFSKAKAKAGLKVNFCEASKRLLKEFRNSVKSSQLTNDPLLAHNSKCNNCLKYDFIMKKLNESHILFFNILNRAVCCLIKMSKLLKNIFSFGFFRDVEGILGWWFQEFRI